MIVLLFLSSIALAQDIPGEELFSAQEQVLEKQETSTGTVKKRKAHKSGNLPMEYRISGRQDSNASKIILPPKSSSEVFSGIHVGESIAANIEHSIIAFPDEPSPVIAIGKSGVSRRIRFIGTSRLEKNTKRIFIDFEKVVIGNTVYKTRGVGVSTSGQPGLIGIHHSRESEYFAGDFVSSFAAGYFDGLIPRYTNVFGQTQTDASVNTAIKMGLATSALSSAERFREKLKRVPEFSEIQGPLEIKILILEKIKTQN